MTERFQFRVSWLIATAMLLTTGWIALKGRPMQIAGVLGPSQVAAAGDDDLAVLEQTAKAFRAVARAARPGVAHIRVAGASEPPDEVSDDEVRALMEQLRRAMPQLSEEDVREWIKNHRAQRMPPASASGIVLDTLGHVLTNFHVVAGRTEFAVRLHDEREYAATLVGVDPKSDLAVLKVEAADLRPLKFADSDRVEVGDWVLAVGAPFGLSQTVTHGIVSAIGRSHVQGVDIAYQDFIQTDAAINPGNSGGPLLNLRGEIVGVSTAIATNGDSYNAGIAFTIPANRARRVAREIIEHGRVVRGWLGVALGEVSESDARLLGAAQGRGVLIDTLYENTPAANAGLLVEDLIISVDGAPVSSIPRLRALIADTRPGAKVRMRIVRDRHERDVVVEVGTQPENMRGGSRAIEGREIERLGLSVRTVTQDYRLPGRPEQGVVVVGTARGEANVADLARGEYVVEANGKAVASVADLTTLLDAVRGRTVSLKVVDRQGEERTVTVKR